MQVSSFLLIVLVTAYLIYVLRSIPESNKSLNFRVPFLPYLPILSILMNFYLMAGLELKIWGPLLVWLGAGYGIFWGAPKLFLGKARRRALIKSLSIIYSKNK